MNTLWVGLGGAIGSIVRYHIGRIAIARAPSFPWGTLAVNVVGEKLSKQTLARAIDTAVPVPLLNTALEFLGQSVVADCAPDDTAAFWSQAIAGWRIDRVPRQRTLPAPAA